MREFKFGDITNSFYSIEKFFGKKWLDDELGKYSEHKKRNVDLEKHDYLLEETKYHPFILTWKNALEQYQKCIAQRRSIPSQSLLEVAALGDYLKELENIKIVDENQEIISQNAWKKLNVRFKDPKSYEHARFELQIAAVYSKKYNVAFVQESHNKNPDLLVWKDDIHVQIECKKKENLSFIEKQNNSILDKLRVKILNYLTSEKKNFLIILRFRNNPQAEKIEEYFTFCKKLIGKEDLVVKKASDELLLTVEIIPLVEYDKRVPITYLQKFKRPNEYFDKEVHSYQSLEKRISNDTIIKNPKIVCIKTETNLIPLRIRSVIASYKKAVKQLTFNFPSLIYIELNPVNITDEDFLILDKKIEKRFSDKPNAVILSRSPIIQISDDYGEYSHKSKVIINKKAKLGLEPSFSIIGLPSNENEF